MKYASIEPVNFQDFKNWALTSEQFNQLQNCISGAGMPINNEIESLDNWLQSRELYLVDCENEDGYQSYSWCRFGKFLDNGYDVFFYETTSGTVLTVAFCLSDPAVLYGVSLPLDRCEVGRTHYTEILYVISGRTDQQQKDWYNCTYQPESREHYPEFAKFHNATLVKKHGYKAYPLDWQLYSALCTLESFSRVSIHSDGSIFSGDIDFVRNRLKTAIAEWDALFPQQDQKLEYTSDDEEIILSSDEEEETSCPEVFR
jgi:hypothetical protein